jgi:hypothetical protein
MYLATLSTGKAQYGQSWMRATVQARKASDRATASPREELRLYLESPLEFVDDVVKWWGVRLCSLLFMVENLINYINIV